MQSYASILYLKRPSNFRIILRGKDVEHHSILDDMMMKEEKTYKPMRPQEWSPDQDEVIPNLSLTFYSLETIFKISVFSHTQKKSRWLLL